MRTHAHNRTESKIRNFDSEALTKRKRDGGLRVQGSGRASKREISRTGMKKKKKKKRAPP